jgi:hypothetical protein
MSNVVEMSRTEARALSVDLDSHESTQDALVKLGGVILSKTAEAARAKYPLGVAAERMVSVHGMTATNVAVAAGVSGGVISKVRRIARLADYVSVGRSDDSPYDESMETEVARLQRFYDLERDRDGATGSLANALMGLVADDGAHRAESVSTLFGVFGSTEDFYNIAKGNRVHPTDEIIGSDDESGDDESGDDESGSQSWQEIISRGVRRAREAGATDSEILAFIATV